MATRAFVVDMLLQLQSLQCRLASPQGAAVVGTAVVDGILESLLVVDSRSAQCSVRVWLVGR